MRYIHCTQNLLKEINPNTTSKGVERKVIGFGDWFANVFGFGKQTFLIFTNVKTLYTFIISDIYRDDIDNFGKTFVFGLIRSLEGLGYEKDFIIQILDEYKEFEIVKTNSRSILASMNDHIYHFEGYLKEGENITQSDVDRFNRKHT
jgi:hypothetical protein